MEYGINLCAKFELDSSEFRINGDANDLCILQSIEDKSRNEIRDDPKNAEAHYRLGNALWSTAALIQKVIGPSVNGNYYFLEAFREFKEAVGSNPNHPDANYFLGWSDLYLFTTLKDKEKNAEAHFQVTLEYKPDHFGAHYELALICFKHHQWDKAINHANAILALNPNHTSAQKLLHDAKKRKQWWKFW